MPDRGQRIDFGGDPVTRPALRIATLAAATLAIAAIGSSCGKKKTAVTEPVVDTISFAGTWTGCTTEPGIPCSAVSMTLADSSLTDSTASVTGTGNWGADVVIRGEADSTHVTLTGTTEAVLHAWTFEGTISGSKLTGTLAIPGLDSTYATTFTRSP